MRTDNIEVIGNTVVKLDLKGDWTFQEFVQTSSSYLSQYLPVRQLSWCFRLTNSLTKWILQHAAYISVKPSHTRANRYIAQADGRPQSGGRHRALGGREPRRDTRGAGASSLASLWWSGGHATHDAFLQPVTRLMLQPW